MAKNKTVLILGLALTILVMGQSLWAGGQSNSSKTTTIGRVVFDMSHPYQQADNACSEALAKSLNVNYIYIDGKSDAEAQANGVTDLISRRVSGIIVQPLDGAAIQPSIDEAIQAKIPIVTFYQQPVKKNVPTVMIDEASSSKALGALAAKKWQEWYPNKPIKIAIIDQPDVAFVIENRSDAFIAGVKSVVPNAEVVARIDGKGRRDTSMAAGDDLLQSHPEANVIFGINDDSSLGCLAAYEAGGRGKAVNGIPQTELIAGCGGTESEMLKVFDPASALKMTMALSARANGEALVDTVMKIINGQIPREGETIITTQNKIIDFYNMSIDDGQKFLTDEFKSTINLRKEIGVR
ncbi:sugar ABC transporter substrate-binding protein [Treponema primitia]|uniref:sugar ABC transporter substrate-binding protein n=1 Tax=Treponema primitia TaxID=88058 RepID=UPI000255547D|nr:sugar ABC transporter substrate-binding protein [Treponema primitia]